MEQPNQKTRGKNLNFFPAPHTPFDNDRLRALLSHAERDFLMVLCHLSNRFADKDGWFWHTDAPFTGQSGKIRGLTSYGFGTTTCKRVRKKLLSLGLIETKENPRKRGRTGGTVYRINKEMLGMAIDHSGPKNRPP